ncbi:hypothetical protein BGZ94_000678 [Podila epigama]|nr:hypothetical protein BGZ94_000678 [Podila epigama]
MVGASSIFIDGQSMYISGGTVDGVGGIITNTNQTFQLDLSVAWPVTNPRFSGLPCGPVSDHTIPTALLKDGHSWLFLSKGQAFVYDLVQQAWRFCSNVPNLAQTTTGVKKPLSAVTDLQSGNVFVPGGFSNLGTGAGERVSTSMMQYTDATGVSSSVAMPESMSGIEGYAAVWSTVLRKMLVHGGKMQNGALLLSGELYAFDPTAVVDGSITAATSSASKAWARLAVNQQDGLGEKIVPSPRHGHCLVPAHGGSKMILFGGFVANDEPSGDILMLDLVTLSWKRLSSSSDQGPDVARGYASCAMAGDMLVVWGGRVQSEDTSYGATTTTVTQNVTFIFNIHSGRFMTMFDPLAMDGSRRDHEGHGHMVPDDMPKSGGSSTGAIVGGLIGGLVVIFGLAALLLAYLKRRRQQEQDNDSMTEKQLTEQEQALYSSTPMNKMTTTTTTATTTPSPQVADSLASCPRAQKPTISTAFVTGAMAENMRRGPHLSFSSLRSPHSPVSPMLLSDNTIRGPQSVDWQESPSDAEASAPGSPYYNIDYQYPQVPVVYIPDEANTSDSQISQKTELSEDSAQAGKHKDNKDNKDANSKQE